MSQSDQITRRIERDIQEDLIVSNTDEGMRDAHTRVDIVSNTDDRSMTFVVVTMREESKKI